MTYLNDVTYPDVYQPCKPVILQQTWVPNSLPMGINYVDYEPQGTEVIQACLQTTPYKRCGNGLALHQNNSPSSVVNSNHKQKPLSLIPFINKTH